MRCLCGVVGCVVAAGILNPAAIAAPMLFFQPPNLGVGFGETFSLGVLATDVKDLFAFQFDVAFDPAILSAVQITEGSFLGQVGPTVFIGGLIDNTAGTISATADTLIGGLPGVSGAGVLATIVFAAIDSGTSPVALSGATLLDSSLLEIGSTTEPGAVTVGIPEAQSVSLLAVGLGALSLAAWRRRGLGAST